MKNAPKQKTVLVFGTFDGLHDGHRFLLREAKKLGDRLIASVAVDETVARFKKQPPKFPLAERMRALEEEKLVDEAVAGDTELGNWSALRKYAPDIVALGYDQTRLGEELGEFIQKENLPITIIAIPPHEPDRLHSRLLREK